MTLKTLLRACGASVLVGAMTLTALPAQAEEAPGRGRAQQSGEFREGMQRQHRSEVREQRSEIRQQRAQAAPQQREQRAQAAPQQREQRQAQRSYSGHQQRVERTNAAPQAQQRSGRDWNRSENNTWGQARAAQAQQGQREHAQAQRRAVAQTSSRQRSQDWSRSNSGGNYERNRTYSDGQRNQTYRTDSRQAQNRYRDSQRTQNHRDGSRYDGHRDGSRYEGHRDGSRYDGHRDGSRYDGHRDGRRYNGVDHRRWSNDWRRDHRYNWHSYRNANRNVYRLGAYYSPYQNYRYSRVGIGFYLDSLFFGSRYWINDPWQYRLPEAYGPYRWVRYYDDALLVDIYSGEVVDVIHDFFW